MNDLPTARVWSGTPRWAKWLLSISLALNFIVMESSYWAFGPMENILVNGVQKSL